jgi:hypothetical protein
MSGGTNLATIGRILIPIGIAMVTVGAFLWVALDEPLALIVSAIGLSDVATGAFLIGQAKRRGELPPDAGLPGADDPAAEADPSYNPYARED